MHYVSHASRIRKAPSSPISIGTQTDYDHTYFGNDSLLYNFFFIDSTARALVAELRSEMRAEFSALRVYIDESISKKLVPAAETSDKRTLHFKRCESVSRLLLLEESLHEEINYKAMVSIISVRMNYNLDCQIRADERSNCERQRSADTVFYNHRQCGTEH